MSGSNNDGKPLANFGTDENGDFTITMVHANLPSNTAYIRFEFGKVTGDFIITRNQLIPK